LWQTRRDIPVLGPTSSNLLVFEGVDRVGGSSGNTRTQAQSEKLQQGLGIDSIGRGDITEGRHNQTRDDIDYTAIDAPVTAVRTISHLTIKTKDSKKVSQIIDTPDATTSGDNTGIIFDPNLNIEPTADQSNSVRANQLQIPSKGTSMSSEGGTEDANQGRDFKRNAEQTSGIPLPIGNVTPRAEGTPLPELNIRPDAAPSTTIVDVTDTTSDRPTDLNRISEISQRPKPKKTGKQKALLSTSWSETRSGRKRKVPEQKIPQMSPIQPSMTTPGTAKSRPYPTSTKTKSTKGFGNLKEDRIATDVSVASTNTTQPSLSNLRLSKDAYTRSKIGRPAKRRSLDFDDIFASNVKITNTNSDTASVNDSSVVSSHVELFPTPKIQDKAAFNFKTQRRSTGSTHRQITSTVDTPEVSSKDLPERPTTTSSHAYRRKMFPALTATSALPSNMVNRRQSHRHSGPRDYWILGSRPKQPVYDEVALSGRKHRGKST